MGIIIDMIVLNYHRWYCITYYCNCLCTRVLCQDKTMKWQVKF